MNINLPKYVLPISAIGTAVGCFVLYKDSWSGCQYKGEEKILGRTVLITGATSGLGKELAQEMAQRGGKVIMACRDMDKCERLKTTLVEETLNRNIHCKFCDLSSMKSVREFAKEINDKEKRLDILINNAGMMKSKRTVTEDGFEAHLGVNHLGPFLLTNMILDKLKESAPSRIINVASVAYYKARIAFEDLNSSKHYNEKEAYMQSKLANVLFTTELAKRLEGTNVHTYAVHPGLTMTNLGRDLGMNQSLISSFFLKPFFWLFFKTPEQGMQSILHCALSPDVAEDSGKFYAECKACKIDEEVVNEERAKRLWLISEKWTRLS